MSKRIIFAICAFPRFDSNIVRCFSIQQSFHFHSFEFYPTVIRNDFTVLVIIFVIKFLLKNIHSTRRILFEGFRRGDREETGRSKKMID